jgi:hypothetical protein
VGVLGALVSFSAAVGFSLYSQPKKVAAVDDDEPLPNITVRQPSKDLGIRTRRDLLPGAAPLPSVPLQQELDALHEARELARNAPPKKPAPRGAVRPAKKPAGDLKDPFGAKDQ